MAVVLIVDDDTLLRRCLRRSFEQIGFDVLEASDGPQGLGLLHAPNKPSVDAVILDYAMPKMAGDEVLREIRNVRPALPVIMFTGSLGVAGLHERFTMLGATAVCDKMDLHHVVEELKVRLATR